MGAAFHFPSAVWRLVIFGRGGAADISPRMSFRSAPMTRNSAATALTKNQIAATVPMIRPTTEYNSFDEYKYGGKVLPIRELA